MKEIYLVRHGDTDATEKEYFAGWMNLPLTPLGRKRILRVREFLGAKRFDYVFASPLARTIETALLLAGLETPLEICEDIKERSFGSWEGKKWRNLKDEFPKEVAEWERDPLRFTPPGGESFEKVLERVVRFWERLRGFPDGRYLVVTHAGVLRCFLVHLLKIRFEQTFSILLNPGALITVQEKDGFPQVTGLLNLEVEP
ncbi:MAG: alpha-ribazole phosphatase [Candidatus Caldatribacterium sp.]|nr:alpha-ribazole phosphatase [Candidatus Caldatribacterium sp.]